MRAGEREPSGTRQVPPFEEPASACPGSDASASTTDAPVVLAEPRLVELAPEQRRVVVGLLASLNRAGRPAQRRERAARATESTEPGELADDLPLDTSINGKPRTDEPAGRHP